MLNRISPCWTHAINFIMVDHRIFMIYLIAGIISIADDDGSSQTGMSILCPDRENGTIARRQVGRNIAARRVKWIKTDRACRRRRSDILFLFLQKTEKKRGVMKQHAFSSYRNLWQIIFIAWLIYGVTAGWLRLAIVAVFSNGFYCCLFLFIHAHRAHNFIVTASVPFQHLLAPCHRQCSH